jgi:poly(hydroxyalkanoate) granule-associated protein
VIVVFIRDRRFSAVCCGEPQLTQWAKENKGGINMLDFMRKMTMAGAGLAIMTTEKIQEFADELVKKGEMTEKEAKEAVDEYVEKSKQAKKDFEGKMEQWITGFLNRMNIPTRKELDEIKERLAKLEKRGE